MKTNILQKSLVSLPIVMIFNLIGCNNNYNHISERTTVYIRGGQGLGTGVIIARNQKTYYVLTTRHVVGIPPGPIEDKYTITLPDGQQYELDYNNQIIKDKQFDLALIRFESDKEYSFVTLNDNLSKRQVVSIFGWKNCLGNPVKEFTSGQIEQILSSAAQISQDDRKKSDNSQRDYDEGYKVKYTNPTIGGMSGSGVFNKKSQVVAIHGKPGDYRDNQYDYQKCPSLNSTYSHNWGIPIQAFLNSELSKGIPLELAKTSAKKATLYQNNNINQKP